MKNKKLFSLNNIIKKEKYPYYEEEIRRRIRLASEIYKKRKELGLNQKDLAEEVKTTQSIISELERADYNPGFGLIIRIGNALKFNAENWANILNFELPTPLFITEDIKTENIDSKEDIKKELIKN